MNGTLPRDPVKLLELLNTQVFFGVRSVGPNVGGILKIWNLFQLKQWYFFQWMGAGTTITLTYTPED